MKLRLFKWTAVMTALLLLSPVLAADKKTDQPNPYLKSDETWISISGTAVVTMPDFFILDYGEGTVTVEMDDWDWYAEGRQLLDGDKVTVYGRIDDDLFETTTIEASSVYVESLGTYFYASAADEEYDDDYDYWAAGYEIAPGEILVRGTVTGIDGREFTIDTGLRQLRVDTIEMMYNPLDDKGYQRVDKGDYVSVIGEMDYDLWEKRELMADTVIILDND